MIKFVIMYFPDVQVCAILSDDRINDEAAKPLTQVSTVFFKDDYIASIEYRSTVLDELLI